MKKKRYSITTGEIKERISEQQYMDTEFSLLHGLYTNLFKRIETLEEELKAFKALNKGNYKIINTYSMFRFDDVEGLKNDGFECVEKLNHDRELWVKKEKKK